MAIKLKENTTSVEEKNQGTECEINKREKPKNNKRLFLAGLIFLVLSFVALLMMGGIALAPFMLICFGVLIVAFWLIITLIPTIFTLGLIWLNQGYKDFFNKVTDLMSDIWGSDGLTIILDVCQKIYLPVLISGCVFTSASLILSIISKVTDKNKNGGKTAVLVISIIITISFIVAAIFSAVNLTGN